MNSVICTKDSINSKIGSYFVEYKNKYNG